MRHAFDNGVQRPHTIMMAREEEFEVQTILNHTPTRKTRTDTGTRYRVQWKGHACSSCKTRAYLDTNAPETLSDYWDELEAAVQAAEPENGSDTALAPSDQIRPASTGRGCGRGHGRG